MRKRSSDLHHTRSFQTKNIFAEKKQAVKEEYLEASRKKQKYEQAFESL